MFVVQMDALPLGSKGSNSAMKPATTNSAPETYIGIGVERSAYSAMIGACSTRQHRQLSPSSPSGVRNDNPHSVNHPAITPPLTITPKTRFAAATSALPVPRSLAGNISGDSAYRVPYMTLFVNV